MSRMAVIERHLRIENNLPDSFQFFSWQCFPKHTRDVIYFELAGGVCAPLKTGKRKGQPNYRTSTGRRVFVVTVEQSDKLLVEYENETGNCNKCMGEGKTVARISVADGTEYRECDRCNGRGKRCEHAA